MADATFRQGSTHRPLRCVAFTESAKVNFPVEFPGGVVFKMVRGSTVITGSATGDAVGNLVYQWAAHDLDVPGLYVGTFTGTDSLGRPEEFPSTTDLQIEIRATI